MITNDDDNRVIHLHDSQALIQIINANITYCLWPRGGGKTGGGIGPRILHLNEMMPRTQILLVSDTYDRLEDRIVPNIIEFLQNKLGLLEDVDFVKYKKPPDHWEKPLIPLDKFDRIISFSSGMALCLVSLRVEGSANAFNAQAAIIDEAKFCDETKINAEVMPALRGANDLYGHLPEYASAWYFTDKFGPKIKWLLKKRQKVNHLAIDLVYTLQMAMYGLSDEMKAYKDKGNNSAYYEKKKIYDDYKQKADRIRKNIIYVSEMKPYENMAAVGEFYFKRQKRNCKNDLEYDVSILNKDPDKVESCFYATLTNSNKYTCDPGADVNPLLPFWISMDYNFRICPMPVVQIDQLPDSAYTTVNFVDALFVLHPYGIEDIVRAFAEKYKDHECKEIHYIYDHTAIGRSPLKTTFKTEVIKGLEAQEWDVIAHFIGDAPDHDVKHLLIKQLLPLNGDNAVRINEITADQMIKSMEMSPAKMSGDKTTKDKSTERDPDWPAEDSTHFGDAFDMMIWGLFEHNLINFGNRVSIGIKTM